MHLPGVPDRDLHLTGTPDRDLHLPMTRRRILQAALLVAGGNDDVALLEAAAEVENLVSAAYGAVMALPFVGGPDANEFVRTFMTTTRDEHARHADAFNGAATRLGGRPQSEPDPSLVQVVEKAAPTLDSLGAVVSLVLDLEHRARAAWQANVAALTDPAARRLTATVLGVEAQHAAILSVIDLLAGNNAIPLLVQPPDLNRMPAAVGQVIR